MSYPENCALHGPTEAGEYAVIAMGLLTRYEPDGAATTVTCVDAEDVDVQVVWSEPPAYSRPEAAAHDAKMWVHRIKAAAERDGWD